MKVSQKPGGRPRAAFASSRCPVEETGMNSVSPSTTPRMMAEIQSGIGGS